MKIIDIEAKSFRVPVKVPLKENSPIPLDFVLTTINTDEGLTGYGFTSSSLNSAVEAFINHELDPFLKGADPLKTERIWSDLYKKFNVRCLSGVWSSGVSAID